MVQPQKGNSWKFVLTQQSGGQGSFKDHILDPRLSVCVATPREVSFFGGDGRSYEGQEPWYRNSCAFSFGQSVFSTVASIYIENRSRSAFESWETQRRPSICCGSTKQMEQLFLHSAPFLALYQFRLIEFESFHPPWWTNMWPNWPTPKPLRQGADNDVWPVGRWWHKKPPSSWDFPCKPLREASLSKLSSRMIRPKMDRLSSLENRVCC